MYSFCLLLPGYVQYLTNLAAEELQNSGDGAGEAWKQVAEIPLAMKDTM
jgi:hypothetical protein